MKPIEKIRSAMLPALGILLLGAAANAAAEGNPDLGKIEYDSHCAACHGATAQGNAATGKDASTKPVPDLTKLSRNHNGTFPFDTVYQIIDGRQEIAAHGSREMPIWGAAFKSATSPHFDGDATQGGEAMVRSRILALVEYLSRLQQK
ncbi:c-type cytochrome [Methylomonas koyamae]|uniref:c-type cytochrome n=1 Tax=Methylomonas koyamae TaxID=702114 RepID=UPI00287364AB|nr:cytochrome c [Methylomonas koyamae]WNB75117.1 cytochrome c [Methylomonas koyamae]